MRKGFQNAVTGFSSPKAVKSAALAHNFAPAGASLGLGRKGPAPTR